MACGICVQYPLEVDAIGFNESRLYSHWVIVHELDISLFTHVRLHNTTLGKDDMIQNTL